MASSGRENIRGFLLESWRTALGRSPDALPRNEGRAALPDRESLRDFVRESWCLALGRIPDGPTLDILAQRLEAGGNPVDFLLELVRCEEAVQRRARQDATPALFVPPGHYYSPIVDPAQVQAVGSEEAAAKANRSVGLDLAAMRALFHRLMEHRAGLDFPREQSPSHRYYTLNDMYGIGDATILACMIRHFRPRRVIEVGSGFSSAVLLDTLDRTPDLDSVCTFVEPYTERLEALLRPGDRERTTIVRSGVQDVPLDLFGALAGNDILFLDTTHVSKTGSDVNHELFEILPILASGVVIHFHDIFDGFEYPSHWVREQNRSWNEQYILRSFLMYNPTFEILYANETFSRRCPEIVRRECPEILENSGGGLWLRKR